MKFNGKELFELGVPQSKIKFFINKEFESKEALLEELVPKEVVQNEKVFTWIDWLWERFPNMPMGSKGELPVKMSKSELRRIFDSKSIQINNKNFTSTCECKDEEFPIHQLVWFPKSKENKCTWI